MFDNGLSFVATSMVIAGCTLPLFSEFSEVPFRDGVVTLRARRCGSTIQEQLIAIVQHGC
jgi:hypothetical protein